MRIRPLLGALLTAVLAGGSFIAVHSQTVRGVDISPDEHGSVPPVSQWFKCFRELQDKPYDKAKSQKCLASILSHSQIEGGKISFKHYKHADVLTFRLDSPSLIVTDIDLGVAAGELPRVHDLLEINRNALRVGEPYDEHREGNSRLVLDLFLRSDGRRAMISSTEYLDYKGKTARVAFKIWDGPIGEPQRLTPPYEEPCEIMNANFNLLDVDDFSPVEFVERQMKTKWLGCFSEADIQDDLAKLRSMRFLKEPNISVDGSGGNRSIGIHLRGNPIPIADVTVHGYGLLEGLDDRNMPALTIHSGDIYSRSATQSLAQLLRDSYSSAERRLKVFADVQITNAGEAELDFSVLAVPHDIIYIDGVRFDNSLPDDK
jgi:hypothetical protein